jgi:hypothetical protein
MKTFKEFIYELTQSELDVEAKKLIKILETHQYKDNNHHLNQTAHHNDQPEFLFLGREWLSKKQQTL